MTQEPRTAKLVLQHIACQVQLFDRSSCCKACGLIVTRGKRHHRQGIRAEQFPSLILQVSSVMGMTVAQNLLLAVYPFTTSLEALKQDLEALEASGFLVHEALATWSFAQVFIIIDQISSAYCSQYFASQITLPRTFTTKGGAQQHSQELSCIFSCIINPHMHTQL